MPDSVLLSLFMSTDNKCNTAHAFKHNFKHYCIVETTQNVFIDPKGADTIICTIIKYGETF